MAYVNNFQELDNFYEPPREIEDSIASNLNSLRMLGEMADFFISQMIHLAVDISGGKLPNETEDSKYPFKKKW